MLEDAAEPLLIHSSILDNGDTSKTYLEPADAGGVRFFTTSGLNAILPLPLLRQVIERYARPLDPDIQVTGPSIVLSDGSRLTMFHYRMQGRLNDVMGQDYLVYKTPDTSEPIAELSNGIAAALAFIVERNAK